MKNIITLLFLLFCFASKSCCQKKGHAAIKNIFPTTDSIPVNILRFYIEFSEPIREENALSHIRLLDNNGNDLSLVFFDNNYELWNTDRTKLTLILDPGRVKSGLKANEALGRIFKQATQYYILVDSLFTTMIGKHLNKKFIKTFIAVKEDTISPGTENWEIEIPRANTRLPFTIKFNEPIDHISALSYLIIKNSKGKKINGNIVIKNNETIWEFIPASKWQKGEYQLLINGRLEDIAANNLNGPFDHLKGSLKNETQGNTETISIQIK